MTNNTASQSGGGIYLQSEMTCQKMSALKLSGNTAMEKGGGIYAVGSLIKAKVPMVKNLILNYSHDIPCYGGTLLTLVRARLYIIAYTYTSL